MMQTKSLITTDMNFFFINANNPFKTKQKKYFPVPGPLVSPAVAVCIYDAS